MSTDAFRPKPVASWEAWLLRLFFAIAVVWGLWPVLAFEKIEMANGLAKFVDVSFLDIIATLFDSTRKSVESVATGSWMH